MNIEDPTFSRTLRDDYSRTLTRIVRDFRKGVLDIVEDYMTSENMGFIIVFSAKENKSYDITKLLQSLKTKVSTEDRQVIIKSINYMLLRGVKNGVNSFPANQRPRGELGRFINEGTLNELNNINVDKVTSVQQDYLDKLKELVAKFIGGGTLTWAGLKTGIKKGLKAIGDATDARVDMIARTEVIRAINIGHMQLLKQFGKNHFVL
jgi:hypothetical protein